MNKEQLKELNKIDDEITKLTKHMERVDALLARENPQNKNNGIVEIALGISFQDKLMHRDIENLIPEFLGLEDHIKLYREKVETRLKELKELFEAK